MPGGEHNQQPIAKGFRGAGREERKGAGDDALRAADGHQTHDGLFSAYAFRYRLLPAVRVLTVTPSRTGRHETMQKGENRTNRKSQEVRMNIEDIQAIMIDSYQVGYMEAVRAYEPSQDLIRLTEVKKWLKMMRIDMSRFKALVKNEIIKPIRKGESRNSPLYYSKMEIKQAFSLANISGILNKETIKSTL